MRLIKFAAAALLSACVAAPMARAADAYPSRAVRIIVPFAPGGSTDVVVRMIAEELQEKLAQPFVVENKPGASGNIGAQLVARAQPDGYTLLFTTSYLVLNAALSRNAGFDPAKDFTPITEALFAPMLLVGRTGLPAGTIPELIAYAKANPGKLNYASSGSRGPNHAAGELLNQVAGTDITHVPYNGAAPGLTAIAGGHMDLAVTTLVSARSMIDAGKVKAIAMFSDKRLAKLPQVPTFAEAGLSGLDVGTFFGLFAPAGTPQPVIDKLYGVLKVGLQAPKMQKYAEDLGAEVVASSPADFAAYISSDIARWQKLAKEVPALRAD